MSIKSVYNRISKRADEMMKTNKSTKPDATGLLARNKAAMKPPSPKQQQRIDDDIAELVVAIRQQRKELLNGNV